MWIRAISGKDINLDQVALLQTEALDHSGNPRYKFGLFAALSSGRFEIILRCIDRDGADRAKDRLLDLVMGGHEPLDAEIDLADAADCVNVVEAALARVNAPHPETRRLWSETIRFRDHTLNASDIVASVKAHADDPLAIAVVAWNDQYPVGTPVRYWPFGKGLGDYLETKTHTPARIQNVGGIDRTVVLLSDVIAPVDIKELEPIAPEQDRSRPRFDVKRFCLFGEERCEVTSTWPAGCDMIEQVVVTFAGGTADYVCTCSIFGMADVCGVQGFLQRHASKVFRMEDIEIPGIAQQAAVGGRS